ncbi:MAG: heavy-metal-associated domain-containing protein [Rhodospirillales bacterium]|nr:heavy-metal-associated domain-containing protein [Magnetospirillum sp.]
METISYRVTGMTCGGCARAMTRALTAQGATAPAEIDLAQSRVTVAGLDDRQVQAAAEAAGFVYVGRTA